VERPGTSRGEAAGHPDRVIAVVGFALEVTLDQPHDPPAPQVDRRQDLEAQVAPPLSPW
jgi:hypothetical protein